MGRPIGHIRILMSSRVLLDLEKADSIFKKSYDKSFEKTGDEDVAHEAAVKSYTDYVCCRGRYKKDFDPKIGGRRFEKGPLWHFAEGALKLNEGLDKPIVEIGLYCKDEGSSASAIFRNFDESDSSLKMIHFRLSLGGKDVSEQDLDAFGTDLFLTRNEKDAQRAINHDVASAVVNFPPNGTYYNRSENEPVRIWVDGDAVTFGSSSELVYREVGLDKYWAFEAENFDKELEEGPFTGVLAKISKLNEQFPEGKKPFELSLLTARGSLSAARVFNIAAHHGIVFNGRSVFLGGTSKADILKVYKPDLFVDDQMVHLEDSRKYCPTGLVAYKEGSPMYEFHKKAQERLEKDPPEPLERPEPEGPSAPKPT